MAPEGCAPSGIQILNGSIFLFQPFPEFFLAQRTVTFPAVFIGNMPQDHCRMFSEAFGKLLIDIKNLFTVYRRSITVVMSSTEKSSCPIRVHTENFLVFICHPFRSGSGWCGKDRINAFFIQIVNYRFQPVKVIFPFFRLQYSPGKHPHGNRVDMCFLKIFDIFFQNVRSVQPLLRIVIATVQEMVISDLLCHFFFLLIFFIMTLYKKDAV